MNAGSDETNRWRIAIPSGWGGDPPCRRRGLTLIEMLVVIAVVGILAGLILPGLVAGKRRAKRTACLGNLRQLTLADLLYAGDQGQLPPPNEFVPSTTTRERLARMAETLGTTLPEGPLTTWPRRAGQPRWYNCPFAVESGFAEGLTLGGGVYTGYAYVGGLEGAKMVSLGFATLTHPEYLADARNSRRGVLWLDVLDEFVMTEARRFEFFHARQRQVHPDFRFPADALDGIHRAWSDGSVEWVSGKQLDLSGPGSRDLQIRHLLGNFYF